MISQNDAESIKKFGKNLKNIRMKRGLTLLQVEDLGWINHKHLHRIEMGHKDVNLSTLIKICRVYSVSVNEVLDGVIS